MPVAAQTALIRFSARALADIDGHAAYFHRISPSLEGRWSVLLKQALLQIMETPHRYPPTGVHGARRMTFSFGAQTYLVDYREEAATLLILRVWHGRQNRPG